MKRGMPITIAVLLVALAAVPCDAQRRKAPPKVQVVSAPPGTRVVEIPAQSGTAENLAPNSTVATTGVVPAGASVETLLNGSFPVPGLGFDFTHHAAVNRNLDVRALIDPLTRKRLDLARQIRRETPVAPAGPVIFNSTQVIVVPQPPVILLQQAAQPEPPEPVIERVRYVEPLPPVAAEPPPPPRELEELVLVRRDGAVLYVVAFVQQRDRILYITADGRRRALPLAELDLESTLEQNEDRGTTLRLSL